MNQEGGRIPPQAVEVEENILGSLLTDREAADIVFALLKKDDFYKPANAHVYEAGEKLYNTAKPIDLITIEAELKKINKLDTVGGPDYLADLTRSVGSTANIEHYCQIVKEMAMRRHLIHGCNEIIQQAFDTTLDTGEVVDRAQAEMFAVTEHQRGRMQTLAEIMVSISKKVEEIQQAGRPIGYRTGLDIDKYLQGFQKQKVYYVGARPSMGKTALVLTIMNRFAQDGITSGILSLETSNEAIGIRMITQKSGVPATKITSGQMTASEYQKVMDAYGELSEWGIFVDDEPALSVQKVRSKCRQMVRKGVQIIFIDFLQLIQEDGRSKHEEIGKITKALKQIAKELDIPIVILSQLNRKLEDRQDKRPQLADLRESGSIEEDADAILFLYRPEYYGITTTTDGDSTAGLCEVIIAKHKDGPVGMQRQMFHKESMRFENFSYIHPDPPDVPPQPHWMDDIDDEPGF